ncbi:zinc finger, CCHC-type containing protein, partial [Tanacetum coccineum]
KKDESANAVEQVDTTKITAMVSEMNIEMIRELHMASVTTTGDWCFNIECSTFNLRHNRLGHINYRTMKDMLKQGIISYNGEHKDKCELCVQAKMKRKPFPKVDTQSEILELVHSDIYELNGQLTREEDRTTPYTPQQNGVAKRKNRKGKETDPDFIDSQAIIFLVKGDNENNVVNKIPVLLNVEDAPKTYKGAITFRNSAFWKEAIDDEMDSLVSNNTWELSDLASGSKAIRRRWALVKDKELITLNKLHPVARITSIRVLFALASLYNLPIHQMDVKTAFLNGDLDEEVYMKQPEGFVLPGHENKVCKLKKSLYGLKQAPKQWHEKFDKSILSNGFTHNSSDRCIYSKFTKDYGVILCLYVDDILIVGTNMEGINETKKFLSSCFQMKDMNEVDTILGIKVKRHSGGYSLNQCHYIDKIIDKFQHLNIEEANTPYESSYKLVENDGRAVAQIEYMICTDIKEMDIIKAKTDKAEHEKGRVHKSQELSSYGQQKST